MQPPRFFIARHGETVFNSAARCQGHTVHTPLTRAGFAHAEKIGSSLRRHLGTRPNIQLCSSPAGRALQTIAIISEHLELNWHQVEVDERLAEIAMGEWSGRYHSEISNSAPLFDPVTRLLNAPAPGGEWYGDVAARLRSWLASRGSGDHLVIMHEMSSRVLRGIMTDLKVEPRYGAPIASGLPQGTVVEVCGGTESLIDLEL